MNVAETYPQIQSEEPSAPDLSHLITEDDTPVDNRYSERQFSLLKIPLFESWEEGKPFEALTDVGLFYKPSNEAVIVPDFLLSLGVEPREVSEKKEDRSYFVWLYGKPPNLVIEVVSNKEGGELDRKFEIYQSIGVAYYAVHDPFRRLGQRELRLFQLVGGRYVELANPCILMEELGLALTFWEGTYLDAEARWIRFVDAAGRIIPTGAERAILEAEKTEQEKARAEQARAEASAENERAEAAEARVRELEQRLRELEG